MGGITELAAAYVAQMQALTPPGMAWDTQTDTALAALFAGTAPTFARIHARADYMLEEMDPRTTLEMLREWEIWAGLPDPCTNYLGTTLSERRRLLWWHLTQVRGLALDMYKNLADALGYEVDIVPHGRPFICGRGRCGQILGGGHIERLVWRVIIKKMKIRDFKAGSSRAGHSLGSFARARDLECLLHKLKPAHTELVVGYA